MSIYIGLNDVNTRVLMNGALCQFKNGKPQSSERGFQRGLERDGFKLNSHEKDLVGRCLSVEM